MFQLDFLGKHTIGTACRVDKDHHSYQSAGDGFVEEALILKLVFAM